jgi:phosphoglycolate phosphatase
MTGGSPIRDSKSAATMKGILDLPALSIPRTVPPPMVRLALFDIDGTLIRTYGAGVMAFARAFAVEFGFPDGTEKMSFAGRTDTGLAREFFRRQGIEPQRADFQRFFDCYVFLLDHYLEASNGGVIPGVREFLHQIEHLPQPPVIGLLTGNIRLGAEIKLRRFGIWQPFRTGAFADDHEERDQIARIAWQRGRQALGDDLRGEEILVIGDTPHDIRCGKAIGARTLAVATGGAKLDALKQHSADWVARDLNDLTAAEVCG